MSTSSHDSPYIIDRTVMPAKAVEALGMNYYVETLMERANKLGGFAVSIIARPGEPYHIISTNEAGKRLESKHIVPPMMVLYRAQNTKRPQTPTDLTKLLD